MKKIYQQPTLMVEQLEAESLICESVINLEGVDGSTSIHYVGSSDGDSGGDEARVKGNNLWDDSDSW
jgi:hypothetical protein